VRRSIGVIPQAMTSDLELSVRENLLFYAKLYGVPRDKRTRLIAELLDAVQLTEWADKQVKNLSGGMRRRVEIARGLVHEPRIFFLDEPTTGLDPQSRANLWDEVNRLRDEGMTIFITTHYLEEADQLCDRVAIIDQGMIVAEGTPAELKREVAGDVVSLVLNGSTMKAAEVLGGQPDIWVLEGQQADSLRLRVESGSAAIQQIMRTLDSSDIELGAIELHRPSLDDVFLAKTGRLLRDA
jgi:ABC-2 type transport system ATP-binding protein